MKRLAKLIEISAVLSLAVVFVGLFGKYHYLLDLCSHFRVQAAFALVLCGLVLLPLKRRRWAIVSLLAGLGLTATLWPFYAPGSSAPSHTYRLLTLNVLASNPHHDRVIDFIRESDPDFIVLQETNAAWIDSLDPALVPSWPYHKAFSRADNFGVVMYSKLPWVSCELKMFSTFYSTPSLAAQFELSDGSKLRLITTHPLSPMSHDKWKSRNMLFEGIAADVQAIGPERTIVAGDFNCTPWSYWYRRLLHDSRLHNAADDQGLKVTWMPIPIPLCGIPIDHVLVGPEIEVSQYTVGPYVGSDHRAVVVDFE